MSDPKIKKIEPSSDLVTLLKELIQANEENFDMVEVSSSDIFNYTVKVSGDGWDGEFIDARNAAYVLDLQKSFQRIIAQTCNSYGTKYNYADNLVKVRLKKGSCEYFVQGVELLKPYLDTMESVHLMISLISGFAVYAGYKITKILSESHERIVSTKNHTTDVDRLAGTVDNALKVVQDAVDVNRKLVGRMRDGDSVLFSNSIEYSYKEAKQAFPRRAPEKVKKDSADGNYEVMGFDLENGKISLLQNGNELSADLMLPTDELSKFFDIVKESQTALEKSLPSVDFRITIEYNSRGIKSALVIGIGNPRDNSFPLSHFINK